MEKYKQKNNDYIKKASPIQMLAHAYYKNDIRRNTILTATMSLTIVLIFGVFSIVFGKLNADIQKVILELGMTTPAWLENGTKEQEIQLENLFCVNEIGRYKKCGVMADNGRTVGECFYADAETFEDIICPAYGKITGKYPQKSSEIMMALSSLEYLGIEEPVPGMKLTMQFDWYGSEEKHTGIQEFVLSGFYEDLAVYSSVMPPIYISRERLDESNISIYPLRILIGTEEGLSGGQLKELLYDRIALTQDDQMFVCMDSPKYAAVQNMLGGYGLAFLLAFLFLLGMFMLIYNVLFISFGRDIKQFGMLNIAGITNRQLYCIIRKIGIKITLRAFLIGAVLGSAVVSAGMPILLQKLYSESLASAKAIRVYNPWFLFIALLFTAVTLFCALAMVVRRLAHIAPIQAQRYGSGVKKQFGEEKRKSKSNSKNINWKKNAALHMAWRNVIRSKRKMCYMLFSLISSCLVALIGTMIINGGDRTNEINKKYSDFTIGVTKDALVDFPYQEPVPVTQETICDYTLISDELTSKIMLLAGTEDMQITYGCFARIDDVKESSFYKLDSVEQGVIRKETAFVPIHRNNYGLYDGTGAGFYGMGIIQVLDENEVKKLEEYIQMNRISADIETFTNLNESGTFIIHQGALSAKEQQKTDETIGKCLYLYSVLDMHEQENTYIDRGQLTNCGYLDRTTEGFPNIMQTWSGQNVLYFFVTEDTFNKLDVFPMQIFQIGFNVERSEESKIRSALKQLIKEENSQFQSEKEQNTELLFLICKSDIMAEQKDYLDAGKIVISIVSTTLMIMGIMNYFNVIATDLLVRQQELHIMNCIGITRSFILKMLRTEGVIYWIVVNGFLLSGGNVIMYFVSRVLKSKIDYFVFSYPLESYLFLNMAMLLICSILPLVMHKKGVV